MAKGHRVGREAKKQKKTARQQVISSPIMPSADVEVVKKKRKSKGEDDQD